MSPACCLAELVGQSSGNATRYLQLQQLELAVGRGDDQRATDLAAALRKSTEDPRILGPMHACAAEQALNTGDLTAAAREILDGLAALAGGALPAEEIRLLSVGARIAADLASLPRSARPPRLADQWKQAAVRGGRCPVRPHPFGKREVQLSRTSSGITA